MADLNIRLHYRDPALGGLLEAYRMIPGPCEMDILVSARAIQGIARRSEVKPTPRYAEFLALSEAVSERLPLYGGVMIHAACLAVDNRAYLFLAPSGTGKTTHMRLWMDALGSRATVVNGDKPFLRVREGGVYAYGSPWAGKEDLHANIRASLGALLFIERGDRDVLRPLTPAEALPRLARQVYMPRTEVPLDRTLAIIDRIARAAPAYLMRCTMRGSAARVAIAGVLRPPAEAMS